MPRHLWCRSLFRLGMGLGLVLGNAACTATPPAASSVALRQVITDETMLRYGAMQIDVFSLLIEARQRVTVNIAAIEAQRDFWLASSKLTAAVAGGGASGDAGATPRVATGLITTAGE